jgi:hypothetical protein
LEILRLILKFELTVQFGVDVGPRPDPGLSLLLGLDMLLLFLLIVKSLHVQLVLEELVLIEVVLLLPLLDFRNFFLHGRPDFTGGTHFIGTGTWEALGLFGRYLLFWCYPRDLRGAPVSNLTCFPCNLIIGLIGTGT